MDANTRRMQQDSDAVTNELPHEPAKSYELTNQYGRTDIRPEDRRKHLDYIQAVVTRMSAASSAAKGWLLPVVTATYGYALTQNAPSVSVLGLGAASLFAYLDAHYLRQEKRFRCLYSEVAKGSVDVECFSLHAHDLPVRIKPSDRGDWGSRMPAWINGLVPGPSVWRSWSIAPFYLLLGLAGVIITFRAW